MCTATWKIFGVKLNYLTDMYPSNIFRPWTWAQPTLNDLQSWSLQSYAVFWKAVSDFIRSSDYVWLSVAGVRTLTDRRENGKEGYVVKRSWQACGALPLRRGMKKRYHAILHFSHGSITSLQTTEVGYRYRLNRLQASNIPLGRKASVWWWLCDYSLPGNDASHYKALWNKDAVNGLMHQLQFYKLLKLVMGW